MIPNYNAYYKELLRSYEDYFVAEGSQVARDPVIMRTTVNILSSTLNEVLSKEEIPFENLKETIIATFQKNLSNEEPIIGHDNVVLSEKVLNIALQTLNVPKVNILEQMNGIENVENNQKIDRGKLCKDIQVVIENIYKKGLPDTFMHPKKNTQVQGWKPDYAEPYENTIKRWIHGPMHISRATLWGELNAIIYQQCTGQVPRNLQDTLMGIGFHDSGREDESHDWWDDVSGQNFSTYLEQEGRPKEYCDVMSHAVSKKRDRDLVEQKIIDGGDCMDILRLRSFKMHPLEFQHGFKEGRDKFNVDELGIYQVLADQGREAEAQAILSEALHFIRLTEDPAVKGFLEIHSDSYYADVGSILSYLNDSYHCYPHITKYLQPSLDEMRRPINPELRASVDKIFDEITAPPKQAGEPVQIKANLTW